MLGVVADAEEVVQEAFLRWHEAADAPRSDEAWLVSVTTRLAIDRLRRAATERTAYEGQWLPEPVPLAPPDRAADLADDLSLAFLLLLERLAPEERAAFLLREVFGVGYDEIARTLEKSEVACRQIVHRAKERVRTPRRRSAVAPLAPDARERVARRFVEALRAEDRDAVLALLTDDAVLVADGGGRMPAIGEVQQGSERIAQLLVGFERMGRVQLERRGGPATAYEFAWLNGEPAVLTLVADRLLFATVLHLDGERVAGLYRVMNPAKLAAIGRPTVLGPDQTLRDLL
jgi:RNA polymerase sigma-70 factor (ECF subfamily)